MKRWILIGQNYFPDEKELYHTYIGIYNSEVDLEEAKKDRISKYSEFLPYEIDDPLLDTIHVVLAKGIVAGEATAFVEACFVDMNNAEKFLANVQKNPTLLVNWSISSGDLVG